MANQKCGPEITLILGEDITEEYKLVKIDNTGRAVVTTGVLDADSATVGVNQRSGVTGDAVDVRLITGGDTFKAVAAKAIALGDECYTAAAGKVTDATTSASIVGVAIDAATADGDVIEIVPIVK